MIRGSAVYRAINACAILKPDSPRGMVVLFIGGIICMNLIPNTTLDVTDTCALKIELCIRGFSLFKL